MGANHIGVDEAGRGPAIGPLVVCALSIPKEDTEILTELGVDDSKNLTRLKRESIHSKIIAISKSRGWEFSLILCDAERIDLWMETGTLNSLEVMAFSDACDVDAERFGRNVSSSLRQRGSGWKISSKHRMDSEDVVTGAASIIAKVNRDWEMEKLLD